MIILSVTYKIFTIKLNTTELKKVKCDHAIQTRTLYITSIRRRDVNKAKAKCYQLQGEVLQTPWELLPIKGKP